MYAVCNRIVANSPDAEEVLQDAFVSAFTNINKLKSPPAFGSWLKQIVVRKSISFVRSDKKIYWESLPDTLTEPLPDDSSVYQLDKEIIEREINQLPEGCRIVFLLHLVESYKHREIAEMLNISISTSKSQYLRAKVLLKERLNKVLDER